MTRIGVSHHFLFWTRNPQNSLKNPGWRSSAIFENASADESEGGFCKESVLRGLSSSITAMLGRAKGMASLRVW